MKTNLHHIKQVLDRERDTLRDDYHIKSIGIFGSVSRGDNTTNSDVDIIVEFSETLGFFKFVELEEYLSERIGKKVELVTKKALKPSIREEILHQVTYV